MSEQHIPLTYERVLEMFRETREQFRETREQFHETREQMREMSRETDRKFQEVAEQQKEVAERQKKTDEQMKKTDKKIGFLSARVGQIVENMVAGNIVDKFQVFGYEVTECCPHRSFKNKKLGIAGEIDLFLDNGDIAILIEVKTTLETADVREHIGRLQKYRRFVDARGSGNMKRYIGAVAGGVVKNEAAEFAQENGLYVIVQSGEAVDIITPPEGFVAKEW